MHKSRKVTAAEWRKLVKKKLPKKKKQRKPFLREGVPFEKQRDKWIKSELRRVHLYRWEPRRAALRAASDGHGNFFCAGCRKFFSRENVQLDHIEPCAGSGDPIDLGLYCILLFVREAAYQVLCLGCHQAKTTREAAYRRDILQLARERLIRQLADVDAILASP